MPNNSVQIALISACGRTISPARRAADSSKLRFADDFYNKIDVVAGNLALCFSDLTSELFVQKPDRVF